MSEAAKSGLRIDSGAVLAIAVSDNVPVYALAASGTGKRISIQEIA